MAHRAQMMHRMRAQTFAQLVRVEDRLGLLLGCPDRVDL